MTDIFLYITAYDCIYSFGFVVCTKSDWWLTADMKSSLSLVTCCVHTPAHTHFCRCLQRLTELKLVFKQLTWTKVSGRFQEFCSWMKRACFTFCVPLNKKKSFPPWSSSLRWPVEGQRSEDVVAFKGLWLAGVTGLNFNFQTETFPQVVCEWMSGWDRASICLSGFSFLS